jgi:hypothetical protein
MAVVTITIANDADFIRGFRYQYTPSGAPVDLTGNKLRMGIRRKAEDSAEEMLLTTENGGLVITDEPGGAFTVVMRQSMLIEHAVGDYEHSLVRIRPDGAKLRVWSGAMTINPGASRGTNT